MAVRALKEYQKNLLQIIGNTKEGRANWEPLWTTANYYYCSYKHRKDDVTPQVKLPEDVYADEPQLAAQTFASGLFGYLTPPASLFFGFRKSQATEEVKAHDEWIYMAERETYNILINSNFTQEIQECYMDFGVNGLPIMFMHKDTENVVRFRSRNILDVSLIEDSKEKLKGYIEYYTLSAAQAYEKWGANAGKGIQNALKANKPMERFRYIHLVFERDFYKGKSRSKYNKKYGSYHIMESENLFVDESGYDKLDIARSKFFKDNRSQYAYAPGTTALSTTRTLNSMEYTNILAAHLMVKPPVSYPEGLYNKLNLSPGAANAKAQSSNNEKVETINTVSSLPASLEMFDRKVNTLNAIFFVDLFKMLMNRKNMTATEVQELVSERAPLLGPAMGRIMNDMLSNIIGFVLAEGIRSGRIPKPPRGLAALDIVYTSFLAKAQFNAEVRSVVNFFRIANEIISVNPAAGIIINVKEGLKDIAEKMAVPPSIINSDEEIARQEAEIRRAQQAQMEMGLAKQGAEAVEKGSKADLNTKKASE